MGDLNALLTHSLCLLSTLIGKVNSIQFNSFYSIHFRIKTTRALTYTIQNKVINNLHNSGENEIREHE